MKCFRSCSCWRPRTVPVAATAQTTPVTATPAAPPADATPTRVSTRCNPISTSRRCRRRSGCRCTSSRSGSRIGSTGRSARGTSAISRRTSSASTRARRSGWSCGTASRRGTQIGIHRTSDRTIQMFGQHNFWSERNDKPLGLDAMATLEGGNNLRDGLQECARHRGVAQRRALGGPVRGAVLCRQQQPGGRSGFGQQHADGRVLAPGSASVLRPIWLERSRRASPASSRV